MADTSIAFIMYPVTDMARAVAFYGETLGLPRGELGSDSWVEFLVDGTTFGVGNFDQVGKPGTASSLALEVADLEAFRAKLQTAGIASSDTYDMQTCRISVVSDPDGNQVWLHQRTR